jgi:hypothetical protein
MGSAVHGSSRALIARRSHMARRLTACLVVGVLMAAAAVAAAAPATIIL